MVGRCIPYWNGHFLGDMFIFSGVYMKSGKFSFFQIRGRYEGHRHFWVSTHDMGKSAISHRENVGDQLSDPWCAKGGGKLEMGVPWKGRLFCLGADGWVLKKHVTVFEDVGFYCRSLGRLFFITSMIWTQSNGFVQEYMINIICTRGSLDILPSKTMSKCQPDTSTNAKVSISCGQIASL